MPKLPQKIVVIKNVDKDKGSGPERWDKPKNRSLACIISPFRACFLGAVSRGKSNVMKNVFLAHQQLKHKKFKKLIIITCSSESDEWADCDPDLILEEIPDLSMFDGKDKTCVILDDYEFTASNKQQEKRLATLMRYISSHKNVSVMLSYQNFFSVPTLARACTNFYVLYKPNSRAEVNTIANRVGLKPEVLTHLFKHTCSGTYDNVCVDLTVDTPAPLRKNLYEPIEIQSDSDSE